jgi:hypothetical protein
MKMFPKHFPMLPGRRIAAICIGVLFGLTAEAATSPAGPFLCIVEQSTGFGFDTQTQSWRQTRFQPGQKLLLKRTDAKLHEVMPGTRIAVSGIWAVWEFGDDHWPMFTCQTDFSEFGGLWCEGVTSNRFGFNLNNGRFITDYLFGYIQSGMPGYHGEDGKPLAEGSNTPAVSIGKCSAL